MLNKSINRLGEWSKLLKKITFIFNPFDIYNTGMFYVHKGYQTAWYNIKLKYENI